MRPSPLTTLVDLQRPIEVRIDDRRVFHGLAQPAFVALAEHFDERLVITHRIRLSPGRRSR